MFIVKSIAPLNDLPNYKKNYTTSNYILTTNYTVLIMCVTLYFIDADIYRQSDDVSKIFPYNSNCYYRIMLKSCTSGYLFATACFILLLLDTSSLPGVTVQNIIFIDIDTFGDRTSALRLYYCGSYTFRRHNR